MDSTVTAESTVRKTAGQEHCHLVHADALKHLPELVRNHDACPDEVMRAARIDPALLAQPNYALEYGAFVRVLGLAAERTGQHDFGLQLAHLQRGGRVIGPVGVVMKNSQTVGQALGYCARHIHAYSLATKVRFRPDRAKHRLFVALEMLLDQVIDTRQVVEHALALAAFNIHDISEGRARARRVSFRHAPQLPLRHYTATFGCDVRFDQPDDGLMLSETDLLCPVSDPDDQVYQMATTFIDQRFPPEAPALHTRVRSLILQLLATEECTSDRVASDLCIHPRTLQRRLRAEGRSFEEIRDEVRRALALRYLQHGKLSLTAVAEKLGYAETSVLSRSCYRWFETSPQRLRQRAAAG